MEIAGGAGRQFLMRMMRCHRIPERCLVIAGWRMPVCARCFGSYVGHIAAIVLFLFGFRLHWGICLAMMVPMGVDWGLQRYMGIMSTNGRRLVTGLLAGFGMSTTTLVLVISIFGAIISHWRAQ